LIRKFSYSVIQLLSYSVTQFLSYFNTASYRTVGKARFIVGISQVCGDGCAVGGQLPQVVILFVANDLQLFLDKGKQQGKFAIAAIDNHYFAFVGKPADLHIEIFMPAQIAADGAFVIRLYETGGTPDRVTLTLPFAPRSAVLVDLDEKALVPAADSVAPVAPVAIEGQKITFAVAPYAIAAVKITK